MVDPRGLGRIVADMHKIVIISSLLIVFIGAGQDAYSANQVNVKIRVDGIPMDTIWVGYNSSFDFCIENDEVIHALSLGFRFWSPDGVTWTWLEKIQKIDMYFDMGCMCMLPDTHWSSLAIEEDSRIYPPEDVFDMSPFGLMTLSPEAMDGNDPDTVWFGGVGNDLPLLEPGPEELMFSLLFESGGVTGDDAKTICLDSVKVGASGDFLFSGVSSESFTPSVAWSEGGKCWAVKRMPCICCLDYTYQGDANLDGALNVGDAVFYINHVFKNGPAPASQYCGEANGDGELNVGDAVYMINYVFKNGDPPVWYTWP
ncbi:MAG: hypothetical protein GY841_07800 [FCB group bacterium]|nr:hypothetical protein [FCB group bacterium]